MDPYRCPRAVCGGACDSGYESRGGVCGDAVFGSDVSCDASSGGDVFRDGVCGGAVGGAYYGDGAAHGDDDDGVAVVVVDGASGSAFV